MKKIYKITGIYFIMLILPILSMANESFSFPVYTEEYKIWLELSEQEKQNYIEPKMYETLEETEKSQIQPFSVQADTNQLGQPSLPAQFTRPYYGNVKNQSDTNACWGYSAATVFETNYFMTNGIQKIFSNLHMDYATARNFHPNGFNRVANSGGNMQIALAYATNGTGIGLEADLSPNNITASTVKNVKPDSKVSDYILLNNQNQIKDYLFQYGVVSATTYMENDEYFSSTSLYNNSNLAYCCTNSNRLANHAITLIGWDDNYIHSAFPNKKGAYVVLNSYGPNFGNHGLYYIFYEDTFVQGDLYGVTKTDAIDYDYLYQYDPYGCIAEVGYRTTYAANVFTRQNQNATEKLKEISAYIPQKGNITIYINANGKDVKIANATKKITTYIAEPGYHTISLDTPVLLENNQFTVGVQYPGVMGIEMQAGAKDSWCYTATSSLGESYVSSDGKNYKDLQELLNTNYGISYANACIKAFTIQDEPLQYQTVNIQSNLPQAGNVSNGTTVKKGSQITVTANPNQGYRFVGWYLGEKCLSNQPSYTFTVTQNTNLVAKFEYFQNLENYAFDYQYYADHNLDLYQLYGYQEEALKNHWNHYGKAEGRKSSCVLDLQYYVQNNSDLRIFTNNYEAAYHHFIYYGYAEYRKSSPEFDATFYRKNHPDLSKMTSADLIVHYAVFGKKELRKANLNYDIVGLVLDLSLYAELNPDVAQVCGNRQMDLRNHWYRYGIVEGRIASFVFDAKYYLNKNPDLIKAYGAGNYAGAYEHFINYGFAEGRQGSSIFSITDYVNKNNDIKMAYANNYLQVLNHFLHFGKNEPRITSTNFNVAMYRLKNADLRRLYGENYGMYFKHYLKTGKAENRICI